MTDEERKKIIERIDFEKKWLFNVCEKEYRVNTNDIEIAMSGIRSVVAGLKEESKEYKTEVITRGKCMICGKELTEGLFFCKECENKANSRK